MNGIFSDQFFFLLLLRSLLHFVPVPFFFNIIILFYSWERKKEKKKAKGIKSVLPKTTAQSQLPSQGEEIMMKILLNYEAQIDCARSIVWLEYHSALGYQKKKNLHFKAYSFSFSISLFFSQEQRERERIKTV